MSRLLQPPRLQKGDQIAIVSTARKIEQREIKPAKALIKSWGFEVVLGNTIGLSDHQFAGTDEQRAEDFQTMMDNNDIKAILCARGGYGSVRILDLLDFSQFTNQPKWIIGYSDVSILHAHINCYLGIQTLHATMPINFNQNSLESLQSLRTSLEGGKLRYRFNARDINRKGEAQGQIIGGNLSILYSILGTKSGFNADNKILFIEDLDEYLYHVDRMIVALKRAGKLSKLKALLIGGMTKMNDNTIPFGKTAEEIILEHCAAYDYPIYFGAPIGHLDDNRALKLGAEYSVKQDSGEVVLHEL